MTEPTDSTPSPQAEWYCDMSASQVGPVTQEQIITMLRSHQISPQTLVWREGLPQALSASAVKELKEATCAASIMPAPFNVCLRAGGPRHRLGSPWDGRVESNGAMAVPVYPKGLSGYGSRKEPGR